MKLDPVRAGLDSQELFPSTCSSPLPFFSHSVFISQYVSARPFIHLCVFLLLFNLPLPPANPAVSFVSPPLPANSRPITRGSADQHARLTPMSISSDLSYQSSSRLGRKIMNSSSAVFFPFFFLSTAHPAAVSRVIMCVPLSPRMER